MKNLLVIEWDYTNEPGKLLDVVVPRGSREPTLKDIHKALDDAKLHMPMRISKVNVVRVDRP